MSNFVKIRPVGAELFYAGGQTDIHDEANSRLSQFCDKRLKEQTEHFAVVTTCVFLWFSCSNITRFQVMAYLLRSFAIILRHNTR
jgi:hypothetical protein